MMIDLKQREVSLLNNQNQALGIQEDTHIMVANKYIIEKKIGKGSFGEVFKGFDKDTNQAVAIKVELSKTFHTRSLLEGKILQKLQNFEGVPKLYYCGTEGDYNVLVIELLGPNLEDILNYCDKRLSLKTVLMIADQLIQRMESIHNRGFLHRDIKADNFLIGVGQGMNKIYAIDFGLSKRFVHPHTQEHILMKKHKGLIGTARYASINAHLGLEQGRRDDLQAIGYLLIYLAKGSLPWQKIKAKTKMQKYKKIFELKDTYSPEQLTEGLPEEFATYLTYVKRLEFEEKPDYYYLRTMFIQLLLRSGNQFDSVFDWMIPKEQRQNYKQQIKRKFKTHQLQDNNKKKKQARKESIQENGIVESQALQESQVKSSLDTSQIQCSIDISKDKAQEKADVKILLKGETLASPGLIQKEHHIKKESSRKLIKKKTFSSGKKLKESTFKNLQVISEKEESRSPQSKLAGYNLIPPHKNVHKIQSEVYIRHLNRVRSSQSPTKQRVNLRVPFQKVSITKFKKFKSTVNCMENKQLSFCNNSLNLKSFKSGETCGYEEAGDIDEQIFEDKVQIYQFTNKTSKLEKEKTLTPSPIKNRVLNGQAMINLTDLVFTSQAQESLIFVQNNQNLQVQQQQDFQRRHSKSIDYSHLRCSQIQYIREGSEEQKQDQQYDDKSSSMLTEMEDDDCLAGEENKTNFKPHLDMSSDEEQVLLDFGYIENQQQSNSSQKSESVGSQNASPQTKKANYHHKSAFLSSINIKNDNMFQELVQNQRNNQKQARKNSTQEFDQSLEKTKLNIDIQYLKAKGQQSSSSSSSGEESDNIQQEQSIQNKDSSNNNCKIF